MNTERFLSFLCLGVNNNLRGKKELPLMSESEWYELIQFAKRQCVLGLFLDALDKVKLYKTIPPRKLLIQTIGSTMVLEKSYQQQKDTIKNLSTLFLNKGIRMALIKGYGLSKLYSIPAHRGVGDLDVYFCGKGQYADTLIKEMGIEVKQNEEKHSVYDYDGVHVENHASIICEQEHPSLFNVEEFLKKELNENSSLDMETGCWLPSTMFNIVFLPLHFAGHFVYGGANLRQIIDYALVVRNAKKNKDFNQIDWNTVKKLAVNGGYFKFLCCLNSICIEYIGISAECFPNWPKDKIMEKRILNEVLNPTIVEAHSLNGKIKRYLGNRWKYQLVYSNENYLMGFVLRTRSWLNWKWGKKSVWKNHSVKSIC